MSASVPKLLGTYTTPAFQCGNTVSCAVRGEVVVCGLSSGPIPWPLGQRGRFTSLVVYAGLSEALRRESGLAVAHHWGVTPGTVRRWRRALGLVGQVTEGVRRLRSEMAQTHPAIVEGRQRAQAKARDAQADKDRRAKIAAAHAGTSHSAEARQRMSAAHRRRGTRPPAVGRPWTAEEDELALTLPLAEAARRTGRSAGAVATRRSLLKRRATALALREAGGRMELQRAHCSPPLLRPPVSAGAPLPVMSRRVPLLLKVAYSAFLCVLVPFYWSSYGPTNFLFFCDVALFLALAAMWAEAPLPAGMAAVGILVPQLLWVIDFLAALAGTQITGMTAYMFKDSIPLFARGLSLFHGWLPFLVLYLVYRLGYDRRSLAVWTVLAWALMLVCYFLMPAPPAPPERPNLPVNINYVYGLGSDRPQEWMHPLLWLALVMVGMPALLFAPAHFLLCRLPKWSGSPGEA